MRVRIDPEIQKRVPFVSSYFLTDGPTGNHTATIAATTLGNANECDIVLLDYDANRTIETLRVIRSQNSYMVIFLSSHCLPEECRLNVLKAGADDFLEETRVQESVIKSCNLFSYRLAKRRSVAPTEPITGMVMHPSTRHVIVHGRRIYLAAREFEILQLLTEQPGIPISRNYLMDRIYGSASRPEDRVLNVFMSNLRTKFARAGVSLQIRPKRGTGYYLDPTTATCQVNRENVRQEQCLVPSQMRSMVLA